MPRSPRLDYPGVFYHVMARGDNRELLFLEEQDFQTYFRILKGSLHQFGFELHAYCLMPNHVHLLMKSTQANLSRAMEKLQGTYSRWFNRKYDRVGHVFQGRYLAKIVHRNAYLLEVGRYIHMNPVKAGIVARPEQYRWSSMSEFLGNNKLRTVVIDALMGHFLGPGSTDEFYGFTRARQEIGCDPRGWPKTRQWYGSPDEPRQNLEVQPRIKPRVSTQEQLAIVADYFKCGVEELRASRGRLVFKDARWAALWILRESTMALREIAETLGYSSVSAVANILKRVRDRLRKDAVFKDMLLRLIEKTECEM